MGLEFTQGEDKLDSDLPHLQRFQKRNKRVAFRF